MEKSIIMRNRASRQQEQNASRTDYGQLVLALGAVQAAVDKRQKANVQAAIGRACQAAADLDGMVWGWKCEDVEADGARTGCYLAQGAAFDHVVSFDHAPWVVYFELHEGQVSFRSPTRGSGPKYLGNWDGADTSSGRIAEALGTFGSAGGTHPVRHTEVA